MAGCCCCSRKRQSCLIILSNIILETVFVSSGYILGYEDQHGFILSPSPGEPYEIFMFISEIFFILSLLSLLIIFYRCVLYSSGSSGAGCWERSGKKLKFCRNIRIVQAAIMIANGAVLLIHIIRTKRISNNNGDGDCDTPTERCQWSQWMKRYDMMQGFISVLAIIDGCLYCANWRPICLKFGRDEDDFDGEFAKCKDNDDDDDKAQLEHYASLSSSTEFHHNNEERRYSTCSSHRNILWQGSGPVKDNNLTVGLIQDIVLKIEPQQQPSLLVPMSEKESERFSGEENIGVVESKNGENVPGSENNDEYFLPQFQRQTSSRISDADDSRYSTLIRQLRDSGIFG